MNRVVRHAEVMAEAHLVAGVGGKKLAILWVRPAACSGGLETVATALAE